MKKRILTTALAAVMMMAMSTSVFATTWTPDPGANDAVTNGTQEVPMYGYVGSEVTDPTDPSPDDPEVNPWNALNLQIPVKFIWAAFDDGTHPATAPVESPEYHIINNGDYDVNVSVTDFDVTNDLVTADGSVTLGFLPMATSVVDPSKGSYGSAMTGISLNSSISVTAPAAMGTIDKVDTTTTPGTPIPGEWYFKINGTYTPNAGTWPSGLRTPDYKVTFNFSI